MKVYTTPLDDNVTDLVCFKDGKVGIRWAGCLFGPEDSLHKIVKDDLLILAQAKLESPNTVWTEEEFTNVDDGLGLRNLEYGSLDI